MIISSNVNVLSDVFQAWNFIILENYFRKSEKFNLQLLIFSIDARINKLVILSRDSFAMHRE